MAGLYVLVGFPESLQLFSALVDDLRLWKEFTAIKGCIDCAFSCGGQYFAATYINSVHIISTYTGQSVAQLRAHLSKVSTHSVRRLDSESLLSYDSATSVVTALV